jgi:hypothetical protein
MTKPMVDYFDPRFPGRCIPLPFDQMTPEQFAEWREDYYLGIAACPFGYELDEQCRIVYPNVPHGMSIHGVPRLRPEDQ